MSKPKGRESVKSAVSRLYTTLPQRFSMISLHAMVARDICRPMVNTDTIRRKLFELREEKLIFFKNIDKARAIYHKEERL